MKAIEYRSGYSHTQGQIRKGDQKKNRRKNQNEVQCSRK